MGKPVVCLDYDGSIKQFFELHKVIVKTCRELGYDVILATMRKKNEADELFWTQVKELGIKDVFFTGRKAKRPYLKKHVRRVDLWIDDRPEYIDMDY